MKFSKKILSLLLCAIMVLGSVHFSGLTSFAEESCTHIDINSDNICDYCEKEIYIDRTWDSGKKTIVDTVKSIPEDAEAITDSTAVLSSGKTYVADGNVRIQGTLTANGDAVIILKDNCSLNILYNHNGSGIRVEKGSSLSVYAQSDGANTGSLNAAGDIYSAGIGGGNEQRCGDITIYGGNITAVGGQFGAGIGGGVAGVDLGIVEEGRNITFYGGNITATGGSGGAGIGGGFFADGENVKIYGGKITAAGGWFGAGIGGGKEGNGGNTTIYGGTVIASCGVNCDIIGHGSAEDPHIFLEDGYVTAGDGTVLYSGTDNSVFVPRYNVYHDALNNKKYYNEEGLGTIYFYADTDATAQNRIIYLEYDSESGKTESKSISENSAFPASALNGMPVQWIAANGNITIDGPVTVNGNINLILKDNCTLTVKDRIYVDGNNSLTIYAQSTGDAMGKLIAEAGIGSSSKTSCGAITVYGGDITATGKENTAAIGSSYKGGTGTVTIYDGKVTATGGSSAAGIGNGYMSGGGEVTIYGGTVVAKGGSGADGIAADSINVYDAKVTVNGETYEAAHIHHLAKIAAKDPGCIETGLTTTYYACTGDHSCGRFYSDSAGETELTAAQVEGYIIPALGHSFTSKRYSDNNNGTHSEKCIRCNKYGNVEPHELVNGKCVKCSFCEHISSTASFTWEYEYKRCKVTEHCDICGGITLVQYSFDISFVKDTTGKDCKTPGKGHYEAVFANLGITGKTDSIFDTELGLHCYKNYVCEVCGDELLDEAKAAAKATIDTAAGENPDLTLKTVCGGAKASIDAADTVKKVFEAQDEWLAVIEKQNELKAAKEKLTATETALNKATAEKSALETQLAAKTAELEKLLDSTGMNDEIAALENSITELEKAVEAKSGQIDSLNSELEKAKAEIEELRKGEDTSCPYCGKEKHESFFDKVLCFFKRIGFFFKILFDFSMDKKN